MSEVLDTLIVKLNATGLQKRDQQLYDFLRNLLKGTSEVDKKVSALVDSSSSAVSSVINNITQQFILESDGDGGGDSAPIPGLQGIQGLTGPQGSSATIMITEDGIDGEMIAIPGSTGAQGSQGIAGEIKIITIIEDGIDGESLPIPGVKGDTGLQGTSGITTILSITEDGIDGETIAIPGSQGPQGVAGVTTLQNTIVSISEDGIDGEPSYIPGPIGQIATFVDFTQDLGSGESSGTFDLTGLTGLTTGQDVEIVQTAQAIASKGNARDEFEMDAIQLTGYVLNSTTIRVYWWSPSVVVGTYAFAFAVSPGSINISGTGRIAQLPVSTLSSAVATGSGRIPLDDTIPQIGEGDEYMTLAFTPINALSTLVIQVVVCGASSAASSNCFALFQDAIANALAAVVMSHIPTASAFTVGSMTYTMIAGTTSPITFRVRAATNSGTFTFNGFAAGRIFGAIPKSSIVITEYLP